MVLRRSIPPLRRKAIKRVLLSRRRRATLAEVREAVEERSEGMCEMALHGCLGPATEICHRIKVGMGGRKGPAREESNRLSNLLHGCHVCHMWCHGSPDEAYDLGLMLREWQDPTAEPVVRAGLPVLLADDGTWEEVA